MSHTILQDILIIFITAIPVAYIFHRIHLPPIIGLIATGMLIGPFGLGWVVDVNRIDLLTMIGITLLLFSIGLEFSFKSLSEIKKVTFIGGLAQVVVTAALAASVGLAFGLRLPDGIMIGCIVALSSTAIVLYIFQQKRWIDSPHGRVAAGILIFQDLSTIPMLALLPLLTATSIVTWAHLDLGTALAKIVFIIVVFFGFGKYLLPHLLHHVTLTRSKELFLLTILVLALGMSYLTNWLGLSFALGAFLGGLMISETDFRFHAVSEISPFKYVFIGLFFVSIGMMFDFSFVLRHIGPVITLLLAVIVGKALIITVIVFLLRYPLSVALIVGLSLGQIGEFSLLVALIGSKSGLLSDFLYNLTISGAIFTILLTPVLITIAPRIGGWIEKALPFNRWRCGARAKDIDAAHMKNHAIICGFGPLGSSVGYILEQASIDYLVLELNPSTVRRIREKMKPVFLGDGASPEILYQSGIERAAIMAITAPDYMNSMAIIKQARALNPKIKIITRAKFRNQVQDLYAAGADIVISEELEAGIEMGRYLLLELGINESTIDEYIMGIRAFGSADFF
jgi:monovalent cation:H+ antiporter-2, CPA2 family